MRSGLTGILLSVAVAGRTHGQTYRLEPDCPPARDSLRIAPDPKRPAAISGEITNRDTGRPIPSAFVLLTPGSYRAGTDSLGAFLIARLPAGRYRVEIRAIGFARYTDSLAIGANAGVTLHVPLMPQYADRCPTVTRVRVPQGPSSSWQLPNER